MGMQKGKSGNPDGRPKGSRNKSTTNAREAIADFVDGNAHRLVGWLDQIAAGEKNKETGKWVVAPDPKAAMNAFMAVVEYHIPKLARTENLGNINHSHVVVMESVVIDGKEFKPNVGSDKKA